MRIAVAALCVLALTGSANAEASAYCLDAVRHIPKQFRGEPSVQWRAFHVPERRMAKLCGVRDGEVSRACTYPVDGYWAVIMPDDISLDEYACRLAYEKAHMPPYFWGDPQIETPSTIKWLAEQRTKVRTSP